MNGIILNVREFKSDYAFLKKILIEYEFRSLSFRLNKLLFQSNNFFANLSDYCSQLENLIIRLEENGENLLEHLRGNFENLENQFAFFARVLRNEEEIFFKGSEEVLSNFIFKYKNLNFFQINIQLSKKFVQRISDETSIVLSCIQSNDLNQQLE